MALQECGLNLDKTAKELQPHGTLEFPCAGYASSHTNRQEDVIPWHWHEEMEISYVEDGQMKIKIPSETFLLEKGDCLVINANMLHYGEAVTDCSLRALVFHPSLIFGNKDCVFAQKYILPLLACSSFSGHLIKAGDEEHAARSFNRAFEALAHESYGYEFVVREQLSRICLFLYGVFHPQTDSQSPLSGVNNLRMKKMLAYIHKHFADNISLSEISRAADISERECLRCFQKTIQLSPIQYVLKYRMMQGAKLLLKNPADSISEIAAACGFDSPSNFSKTFKHFYNYTPREYRSRNK